MAKRDEHEEAEAMREDVPSTIARSGDKAVRTYKKTLESAEDSYGDGERARTLIHQHITGYYAEAGLARSPR